MIVQYSYDKETHPPYTVSVYASSDFIRPYQRPIRERDQVFGRALLRSFLDMNAYLGKNPLDRIVARDGDPDESTEVVLDSSNLGIETVQALSPSRIPDPDTDAFTLAIFELDDQALAASEQLSDAFITNGADEVLEAAHSLGFDHFLLAKRIGSFVIEPPQLA